MSRTMRSMVPVETPRCFASSFEVTRLPVFTEVAPFMPLRVDREGIEVAHKKRLGTC